MLNLKTNVMEKLKCKIVMLPTEKATWPNCLWLNKISGILHLDTSYNHKPQTIDPIGDGILPQHLYFVSEREVIINDYYIVELYSIGNSRTSIGFRVEQCESIIDVCWVNNITGDKTRHIKNCFKVEATTDPSLNLPLIPQSFIEKYVEKQGEIDEVMIEIIEDIGIYIPSDPFRVNETIDYIRGNIIKTRKDNTVIVSKVEEKTYSEVEMFLNMQYYMEYCQSKEYVTPQDWIENYKHF